MKQAYKISYLVGVAAAMMIAGTVFLLFAPEPEVTTVSSFDQRVFIEGVARESQSYSISAEEPAGGDVLIGQVYRVDPSATILDEPARVTFRLYDPAEDLIVYRYDPGLEMWTQVNPVVARTQDSVSVEVERLGRFSLGRALDLDAPEFLSVYDELFEAAPEKTVGFEIASGYRDEAGPIVQFPNSLRVGGCDGIVRKGNREERSMIDRQSRIFINDVETLVDHVFVARWFINDLQGCAEGEGLESF